MSEDDDLDRHPGGIAVADTLAIVDRKTWEGDDEDVGWARPGDGPLKWRNYHSNHPLLNRYLEPGDRLFLVTARPGPPHEQLWLVAVYENIYRNNGYWVAKRPNRICIVDITRLRGKLRFHTGKGILQERGKLGNSLQTPRLLTAGDIELLEAAIRGSRQKVPLRKNAPLEFEAEEGTRIQFEAGRYTRSPSMALQRLARDKHKCCHCGFSVQGSLVKAPKGISRILHIHHVQPLHLTRETKTRLDDLLTLCPTCHSVAHALARMLGVKRIDLKVLRKHYPISA